MAATIPQANAGLAGQLDNFRAWDAGITVAPTLVRQIDSASNENFLVEAGTQHFVVRLNQHHAGLGVDRALEEAILGDIKRAPFSPRVVYLSMECMVTEYIAGTHPAAHPGPDLLQRVGRLFRAIHRHSTSVEKVLDPSAHARRYLDLQPRQDTVLTACAARILENQPAPHVNPCLCHHDLTAANIIVTATQLIALDWEYACIGDPAFDIAVFAETARLESKGLAHLLEAYGDVAPDFVQHVAHYRLLYHLIEVLWWQIRAPQDPAHVRRVMTLVERAGATL